MIVRPEERQRQSRFAAITLLFLLAVTTGILWRFRPPDAVPVSAPPDTFSSGRAMVHIREIARTVHSTGTPESARVRDYLLGQFHALGLKPVVQDGVSVSRYYGFPCIAHVKNIVVRVPGTAGGGPALMLVAHYDSVPTGPGAGDDAAAVAALLETVRALKAGPPLKNDLLVLLTDGEERGLFGAKVFVEKYTDLKSVRLALNFEGRGCSGPTFLFETTEGNAGLITEAGHALSRPNASSLFYSLYKMLPNDTDLTVFKQAGMAGLNFAFVDGWNRYHTPADTVENLDERSLQHHGMYALSLARRFGNADLDAVTRKDGGDAIFFDLLGVLLIRYPQSFVGPLTVCAVFAYLVALVVGFKGKWLTPGGFFVGLMTLPVAVIAAGFGASFLWSQFLHVFPDFQRMPWGDPYGRPLYEAAFALLTLFVFTTLHALLGRTSPRDRTAGALFWWAALLVVVTQFAPGTSYAFLIPLLVGLISLAVLPRPEKTLLSGTEEIPLTVGGLAVLLLCGMVVLLLWTQLIHGLFLLVSFARPPVPSGALALALGLLTPQIGVILTPRRWPLPLYSLVLGAGLLIGGGLMHRFDAAHPATNTLFYAQGTDAGKAVWASREGTTDDWTAKYLTQNPRIVEGAALLPWVKVRYQVADAPELQLAKPEIGVLSIGGDKERNINLRILSPRHSPDMYVQVDGANVTAATVSGKKVPTPDGHLRAFIVGVPDDGFKVDLTVNGDGTPTATVDDYGHDLPEIPGQGVPKRPADRMRATDFPGSDTTLVRATLPLTESQVTKESGTDTTPLLPSLPTVP